MAGRREQDAGGEVSQQTFTPKQVGAIAEKAKGGLPSAPKLRVGTGRKVTPNAKLKKGSGLSSPVKPQWETVANKMLSGPGAATNF
jgi:hypothetical protein